MAEFIDIKFSFSLQIQSLHCLWMLVFDMEIYDLATLLVTQGMAALHRVKGVLKHT